MFVVDLRYLIASSLGIACLSHVGWYDVPCTYSLFVGLMYVEGVVYPDLEAFAYGTSRNVNFLCHVRIRIGEFDSWVYLVVSFRNFASWSADPNQINMCLLPVPIVLVLGSP